MAVVSDFSVVTKGDYLQTIWPDRAVGEYKFPSGGHTDRWPALLDISVLGGWDPSGLDRIGIRFSVNGTFIAYRTVSRFQLDRGLIYDRLLLLLDPGVLSEFTHYGRWNTLHIQPYWSVGERDQYDHVMIGPIVCHFQQEA